MALTPEQRRSAARNFYDVARHLAAGLGERSLALALAEQGHAPEIVRLVLKTGIPAQTVAGTYTAADAPHQMLAQAMLASVASFGFFDRVAADAMPLPYRQRLGISTGVMAAVSVDEAKPVAVQGLQLTDLGPGMTPMKTSALCVLTRELAQVASTVVALERELRTGLARSTDTKFLSDAVAATTPIASSSMLADIPALIGALTLGANAKVFAAFEPAAVRAMAMARGPGGAKYFPDLDYNGGMIDGVAVIASDGLEAGQAVAIDAAQLGVNTGDVGLSVSQQSAIELSDAPAQDGSTSAGAELVSMFQASLVGVKVTRNFAYSLFRDTALASLSGVSYGA
jgi:hypothetical protein